MNKNIRSWRRLHRSRVLLATEGCFALVAIGLAAWCWLSPRIYRAKTSVVSIAASKQGDEAVKKPSRGFVMWGTDWKDPLDPIDLEKARREEGELRKRVGEASKLAEEPLVIENATDKVEEFRRRAFGMKPEGGINSCREFVRDLVKKSMPRLAETNLTSYDDFYAENARSPHSGICFGADIWYRDYDYRGPKGRFRDGRELLASGRAVLRELSDRLGVSLQEFKLFTQPWPYHPGQKRSQCWSGVIPDRYLCSEGDWSKSRHAFATSRTHIGNLRVYVSLSIIYYDEYNMRLSIRDESSALIAKQEFYDAYRKKHPGAKRINCRYEPEIPHIIE